MKRRGGDGVVKTPDEITAMKWCTVEEAKKLLSYTSDLRLLELLNN
jgi:hypothetical protein